MQEIANKIKICTESMKMIYTADYDKVWDLLGWGLKTKSVPVGENDQWRCRCRGRFSFLAIGAWGRFINASLPREARNIGGNPPIPFGSGHMKNWLTNFRVSALLTHCREVMTSHDCMLPSDRHCQFGLRSPAYKKDILIHLHTHRVVG